MTVSEFGRIDKRIKDAILLFEFGLNTQIANSEYAKGISELHLTKGLSALLRHWEILRESSPSYADLHVWGIHHTPHRYGEVVFRHPDVGEKSPNNPYGVMFIKDMIDNDIHLGGLRVRFAESNVMSQNTVSAVFFPMPEPTYYADLKKAAEVDPQDIEVVRILAILYASLLIQELAILATCPSESACFGAIKAEITLWLYDMDKFLRLTREPNTFASMLDANYHISNLLNSAFMCGLEIGVKREMYSQAASIANKLFVSGRTRGLQSEILSPLLELGTSSDGRISDRIDDAIETARTLTAFVGLVSALISAFGLSGLSPDKQAIAQKFQDKLDTIGLTNAMRQRMYQMVMARDMRFLPDLCAKLREAFQLVLEYLNQKQLPTSPNTDILFEV